MQLVFDQVSYAYSSPAKKKKKKSQEAQNSWGNDPNELWAIQDVSFTLNQGDFLGICGHTGSGKSTLVQHMNGLLSPTKGKVLFNGEDLNEKSTQKKCRGEIGVVFQYPEHQLFAPTVFDDVAFGPRNLGMSEDEVSVRVKESIERMGLDYDHISSMSPFELSGGQQRRVAFAGVLAMRPSVLILDEPAAGLDPQSRRRFLGLISDLHKQGLTVVMVSHSMEDLAQMCTNLLVLNKGKVAGYGTPEQVFSHEKALHDIGLDVPAAQRMAINLRKSGIPLPEKLYSSSEQLADSLAEIYFNGAH